MAVHLVTAYLVNHSDKPRSINFVVTSTAVSARWRGAVSPFTLAAGEHRRIDFGLEADARQLATLQPVELTLRDVSGARVDATTLTLTGPLDKPTANRAQ
jgi:hypothetical protein